MCWALLCFMISFNLIIPELNEFITDLGGADKKGLIFLLFSVSAAISRPFSGKLSDTIGRKKVMYIGMFIGLLTGIIYPLSTGVFAFLALRFAHGFSAGFLPTGATAMVTDIIPEGNRGVAMGVWGTFISVGFGVGNFFAHGLKEVFGLTGLFLIAATFCLAAGIMVYRMTETLPNPQKFKWSLLKVTWNDVFEPTVRPAAFVMACSTISTGFVFVTSSDLSTFHGIENKGWFFLFYMISTIAIRLFASSLSDKIGRRITLIIGLSFMVISMLLIAGSTEWFQYTMGAIAFGVSTGISSPTIMAWVADLSPPDRRGVGAGTLFMALEMGIIIGSFLTLISYNSTIESVPFIFTIGACFALLAIIYLIWHLKYRESKT
jgi:MFS family permease